jgi:beta-glucosidase
VNFSRYLHAGKAVNPWQLQLLEGESSTVVTDPQQQSATGALTSKATDRLQQEDSILLTFSAPATAAISHAQQQSIDLARQANGDMVLELEYQLVAMPEQQGKVQLGMRCASSQPGCETLLDFSTYFAKQQAKGWQQLKIPLRCFTDHNKAFDLTKISHPLLISAGKGLQIQLARVRLTENEGNGICGG